MKSEFFCNKCMKHLHVKFLAYRYSDNKKACCTHCKELVEQRAKPESSESRIKEKNKKVTLLDSFYVEKRRELAYQRELREIDKGLELDCM